MEITTGKRLKARATQLGLKPSEIAAQAGINRSFVYDVIAGRTVNPCTTKLTSIAEILKCDRNWLQTGIGQFEGNEPSKKDYGCRRNKGTTPPEGFIEIQVLDVQASMGGGTVVEDDQIEGYPCYFRETWIQSSLDIHPDELRIMRVKGDSMEPTLMDKDTILVDTTDKSVSPPGLYVLYDGSGIVAKRLAPVALSEPTKINVISDNRHYPPYDCLVEEINIIGRIKWFGRDLI